MQQLVRMRKSSWPICEIGLEPLRNLRVHQIRNRLDYLFLARTNFCISSETLVLKSNEILRNSGKNQLESQTFDHTTL